MSPGAGVAGGFVASFFASLITGAAAQAAQAAASADPAAPAAPASPADPFRYPTWLTMFSPAVLCDILVECLVLLTHSLVMAAIAHRPGLWAMREDLRRAEEGLRGAEARAAAGPAGASPDREGEAAALRAEVEARRRGLGEKQAAYERALREYEEWNRLFQGAPFLSRTYLFSMALSYFLGFLHSRLYLRKYRRGVTWLFVFPEGVFRRGLVSWLLALRTGRKEPGVVGYTVGRMVLGRPIRRLAARVFPPFNPRKGRAQTLREAFSAAMAEADRRFQNPAPGAGAPFWPPFPAAPLPASRQPAPAGAREREAQEESGSPMADPVTE